MTTPTFDEALCTFFKNNLSPGYCYPGTKGKPFTTPPMGGKLVYQDGTACSASHALSDVFLMEDGSFVVQTNMACARFTGDSHESESVEQTKCQDLSDVLIELSRFNGHDPNTTGTMLRNVLGDKTFYKLFKTNSVDKIIELLKDNKKTIDGLVNNTYQNWLE